MPILLKLLPRVEQIIYQLKQDRIQSVALFVEDANTFIAVLLACLNQNVEVWLLPNLLTENYDWAKSADLFLDTKKAESYGITQKLEKIAPHFSHQNSVQYINKQAKTKILLKTSGSSGQGKIITKTAEQMWQEVQELKNTFNLPVGEQITLLSTVSFQHLYGLTFQIFLALEMGWNIHPIQLRYPEELMAQSKKDCVWITSPAILKTLNLDLLMLANFKTIQVFSAGNVLNKSICKFLQEKIKLPLIEIYGSTETGIIAYQQNGEHYQPFPHCQIGCNDNNELWVKSPWTHKQEQTADKIALLANKQFELLGRSDRIVKIGDKRINLLQIEQTLLAHNFIADCFIIMHPTVHRPLAWIELSQNGNGYLQQYGRKTLIHQLKTFLLQYQDRLGIPRFWRFSAKLPRNSQGKISYQDVLEIID